MTVSHHARRSRPRRVTAPRSARCAPRGLRVSTARRLVLEALFAADGAGDRRGDRRRPRRARCPRRTSRRSTATSTRSRTLGLVRHVHVGHGARPATRSRPGARRGLRGVRALRPPRGRSTPRRWPTSATTVHAACGFAPRFAHFPIVGRLPGVRAMMTSTSCSRPVEHVDELAQPPVRRRAAPGRARRRRPARPAPRHRPRPPDGRHLARRRRRRGHPRAPLASARSGASGTPRRCSLLGLPLILLSAPSCPRGWSAGARRRSAS